MLSAADRLLTRAREERKPAVLEVVTYRYRGHSVADAGTAYRTQEEMDEWKKRDPLLIYGQRLLDERRATQAQIDAIQARVEKRVEQAVEAAEASPRAARQLPLPAPLRGSAERRAVLAHEPRQPVRRARARPGRTRSDEHHRTRPVDHDADVPRGGPPRPARGAAARRGRLPDGRGDRRLRGLLQGHRRPLQRVRPDPRARDADLGGGLRRRRHRRGDDGPAPGRRDHDAELHPRRDGPGREPRGEDPLHVRRRGRLPARDPHAQRRRFAADGASTRRASRSSSPTRRA